MMAPRGRALGDGVLALLPVDSTGPPRYLCCFCFLESFKSMGSRSDCRYPGLFFVCKPHIIPQFQMALHKPFQNTSDSLLSYWCHLQAKMLTQLLFAGMCTLISRYSQIHFYEIQNLNLWNMIFSSNEASKKLELLSLHG